MKSFSFHHKFVHLTANAEQKIIQLLSETIEPEAVFLLGATLHRRKTDSIFCSGSPTAQHINDYFLLVIVRDTQGKPLYEWQDKIEQYLKEYYRVTVIVLDTNTFEEWLTNGHKFALNVMELGVPIFKKEGVQFSLGHALSISFKTDERVFQEGITRAKEFLAGAELYILRKQFRLAVFMLHQATEHSLSTLIKTAIGYHTHTHNLERLLRYASMVCYRLPDVFPTNAEPEKMLLKLLQKGYSEARYSENYSIQYKDLQLLFERVKEIIDIAKSG
ncbi:HEPN domain-containing protein [Pinibacter soli]|uniref:HEPN domain-containing protein n=1 Tax=Pinibacter soli TaxID=3044211 RepID=A0ABT6RHC2_9BACT|nr:HEPN domain-containing protein [Pinibacter soli]MDI3321972.1 HEPN domain-containing protein [Pinibacter soli]